MPRTRFLQIQRSIFRDAYAECPWHLETTYNRKRLAELVTKLSGIAFSRLLFRRLQIIKMRNDVKSCVQIIENKPNGYK